MLLKLSSLLFATPSTTPQPTCAVTTNISSDYLIGSVGLSFGDAWCPQPLAIAAPLNVSWHHQHDIVSVPRGKLLDRAEAPACPTPAPGEFPQTYTDQWNTQFDVPQVKPWKILDKAEVPACPKVAPGEFLANYIPQWHHGWDYQRVSGAKLFDASAPFSLPAPVSVASITVFDFTQWDVVHVNPFRTIDREIQATPTPAPFEFEQTYISQWDYPWPVAQVRPWKLTDQSLAPSAIPVAPSEFLGDYEQWHHQHDLSPVKPWKITDSSPTFLAGQGFVFNSVGQWIHQHDIRPVNPWLKWDRAEVPACPTRAPAEFLGDFVQWHHTWEITQVRPWKIVDRTPTFMPGQGFVANYVAQWHHQWDVPQVRSWRIIDRAEVPACPSHPAPEFLGDFVQWQPQHDVAQVRPWKLWDRAETPGCPTIAPGEFLTSYISQWDYPWPSVPVARNWRLTDQSAAFGYPYLTTVIPNFVSQWHHTWDLPHLTSWKLLDRSETPATPSHPTGEFLGDYLQWHHAWDLTPVARTWKLTDQSVPLGTQAPAEFLGTFVQWHHQWDVTQVRQWKLTDTTEPWSVPAAGEFPKTYVAQWHHTWDVPQVRPWKFTDQSLVPSAIPVARGEFALTYLPQWLPVDRAPQRASKITLLDTVPVFPVSAISVEAPQWHHQHDIAKVGGRRLLVDRDTVLPLAQKVTATFVSQWHHQWDFRPLQPWKFIDRAESPDTPGFIQRLIAYAISVLTTGSAPTTIALPSAPTVLAVGSAAVTLDLPDAVTTTTVSPSVSDIIIE